MNTVYPLVSVLVPVYAAEKYILRCAKSLFEQTYNNIEFVFVNDCTPDDSIRLLLALLDEYPKRRGQVKILTHEKNQGVAVARNTLLANATGEYILWVDADDYIDLNTIEYLVRNVVDTNIDILIFQSINHTYSKNKRFSWKEKTSFVDFVSAIVRQEVNTAMWGKLIKHSLFTQNKIFFPCGINIGEDLFVLLKLMYYSSRVEICSECFYHRDFTNDNSLVHSSITPKRLKEKFKLIDYIRDFFKNKFDVTNLTTTMELNTYIYFIYNSCMANNKRAFHHWNNCARSLDKIVRPSTSKMYRFFLYTDNFYISTMWALNITILRLVRNRIRRFMLWCRNINNK